MEQHNNINQDRQRQLIGVLLAIVVCLDSSSIVQAAATDDTQDMVSMQAKCNCSITMACSCCESAVVNAMDVTKSVCVTFKIDLNGLSVDVTISLDGDAVSQFTLDTKSPPNLCLPVISDLTSLTVCLKMTMNLASATSLSICPNFYSNYDANQILAYNFPCINVGMDGISFS